MCTSSRILAVSEDMVVHGLTDLSKELTKSGGNKQVLLSFGTSTPSLSSHPLWDNTPRSLVTRQQNEESTEEKEDEDTEKTHSDK